MIVICFLKNVIKLFRLFSEFEKWLEIIFYVVNVFDNLLYNGVLYFYKMNVFGFDEL